MTLAPLLIAIVIFRDARRFRLASPDAYASYVRVGPLWWSLASLFLPFVLPLYYVRRRALLRSSPPGPETSPAHLAAIDGAGVLTAWALPSALISVAAVGLAALVPSMALSASTIGMNLSLVALLACVSLVTRPRGMWTYREALSLTRGRVGTLASIGIGVVVGLGLAVASDVIEALSGPVEAPGPLHQLLVGASRAQLLVFALGAIAITPVLEELVFRGWGFRVASTVWSARGAIALISVLFWLEHVPSRQGNVVALRTLAVAAIALTGLRAWTGSVTAPIVAHTVFNATAMASLLTFLAAAPPIVPADPAQHETFFEELLEERPSNATYLNELAWILATKEPETDRDLDRALELVNRALRVAPGTLPFLDTKSEILWQQGRKEEAREIARHLLARDPASDFFRARAERYGMDTESSTNPTQSALDLAEESLRAKRYAEAGQFLAEAKALIADGGGGGGRFARAHKLEQELHAAAMADPAPEKPEPLLRSNPAYPRDAERNGIEGWVYLQFTVTKEGRTSEIVVLDADPKDVFEEAAIEAVRAFRYRPKGVDGVASDHPGEEIVLSFDIQ